MGTAVMLLGISGCLLLWDFFLKALSAFFRPAAVSFLDAHATLMARRLLGIARVYGGLIVDLDRRLEGSLPNPCLICANHQSVADIAVLLAAFRHHKLRFVAKRELTRGFPAVSEVLRIQRHALIDRKGGYQGTARALRRLGRSVKNGHTPVVFPEGTRSRTGEVTAFHAGGVRAILSESSVPIVGVAVDGGHLFSGMSSLAAGVSGKTYRAALVGVYRPTNDRKSVHSVVKEMRTGIREQLQVWRSFEEKS